jgi:protein-arginine deiminase
MIAAVRALMPPSVEAVFLDDWFVYHMGLGEVHCGTNITRAPLASWWTAGAHLLQD